ncbi:unnamed protein product, partial [marine sediment metagenome]
DFVGGGGGFVDPCAGNTAPVINEVTLDGELITESRVYLTVGTSYTFCVYATDDGILPQPLAYSLTIDGDVFDIGTSDSGSICFSGELLPEVVGNYTVYVNVSDGCEDGTTTWPLFPFTVVVEPEPAEPGTYTVTYHGNGSTGGTVPVDGSSPYYAGVEVTVLGQGGIDRTNYGFTGWNTLADGTGTGYVETDTFTMPVDHVTLYAQWIGDTKYNVTYDANGGTGTQTDSLSPYYAGVTVIVLGQGSMDFDRHNFTGWNTLADGTGTGYVETDTFTMPG